MSYGTFVLEIFCPSLQKWGSFVLGNLCPTMYGQKFSRTKVLQDKIPPKKFPRTKDPQYFRYLGQKFPTGSEGVGQKIPTGLRIFWTKLWWHILFLHLFRQFSFWTRTSSFLGFQLRQLYILILRIQGFHLVQIDAHNYVY